MNPNKALWEKGDFTRIAESMRESGEALVKGLGITKGLKVLDLGCGDGTTALPEARLGADVLGVDIAKNLVEAGNRRAKEEGLTNCKFQEGDASKMWVAALSVCRLCLFCNRLRSMNAGAREAAGQLIGDGYFSVSVCDLAMSPCVLCAGFRTPAMTSSPRAEAAGVRKAPRQEIAVGSAPAVRLALWGFSGGVRLGMVGAGRLR